MSERTISREEAIERVELHLRELGLVLAAREEAEEIVEAIGAWEEEDKPPELPEGWRVLRRHRSDGSNVEVRLKTENGMEVWIFRSFEGVDGTSRFLARALAALRQDDGEVEVEEMVPLHCVRDLLRYSATGLDISTDLPRVTVPARRVRP
jgi:hypothetical protein